MSWSNETKNWWQLTSDSLYDSFLDFRVRSNKSKGCMRVDESQQASVYMGIF